ncbi:MAG: hypothetical protein IKW89_03850 [Bacteroidales bacterium]|nr:hypothetical protein [Bacteroidales bacterium]
MGKKVSDYLSQFQIKSFLAPKDLREIGLADFGKAIDIALDSSDNLVVVASSADYAYELYSPYVYYEWHTFAEEKKSGRKRGNIMTIVSNKSVRNQLPIGLRNYQSFDIDDFSDIVGYIRKDKKGQTIKQERLEEPSKPIVNDTPAKPRSRFVKKRHDSHSYWLFIRFLVAAIMLVSGIIAIIIKDKTRRNHEVVAVAEVIQEIINQTGVVTPDFSISTDKTNCSPVDLGLPSGTLWGDRNVGAQKESDFGDLFSWGETAVKRDYTPNSYSVETKPISKITTEEFDAAKAILGDEWSLPTEAQFQELIDFCEWNMTKIDDHIGFEIIGKNGNKLFLPAAGWDDGTILNHLNENGYYWTSERTRGDNRFARHLLFPRNGKGIVGNGNLYYGRSIRAVYSSSNSHLEAIAE